MAKPVNIPNTFATSTSAIPLSYLDQDFNALANATNDLATYSNYVIDTGAVNAYIANYPTSIVTSSLIAGLRLQFKAANTNTGASTLNVQVNSVSIGSGSVRLSDGTAIPANTILANAIVDVQYDGTNFQVMNDPSGGAEIITNLTLSGNLAVTGTSTFTGNVTANIANITTISSDLVFSSNGAVTMPSGTTGEQPGSPQAGMIRYNVTTNTFEGYGSSWGSIGGGATGGGGDEVFVENDQTVTTSYTISSGKNAMSTGPITINSGVVVTVPSGARWVVLQEKQMASSINASTSGAGGVITTADATGTLQLQSGGTTIATISSTGISTQVGAPTFGAYQSSSQTGITNGVFTKILFQTEEWDTNNNFASSTFTPTVAGYYQVNAGVAWSAGYSTAILSIYKNGSAYKDGVSLPTNTYRSTVNAIVYCNGSTDYIEIYGQQTSGGSGSLAAAINYTYFQAAMIRSA